MGRIYCLMGKSSSGKDTLYKEILERCPALKTVVLYTTRPIREGERNGVEYYFVTPDELAAYDREGKVIEQRTYPTMYGGWTYATVDDGQVDLAAGDYLIIGTLESYQKLQAYYGEENVVPLFLEVEDGERLARALARERQQTQPKYDEMCRRFLADQEDFSEENIRKAGITRRYINDDKARCRNEIIEEITDGKL